ncbi:hypothetical protein D050_4232B, partial [Vibrio parahaemolyticus VPCR-2009]
SSRCRIIGLKMVVPLFNR